MPQVPFIHKRIAVFCHFFLLVVVVGDSANWSHIQLFTLRDTNSVLEPNERETQFKWIEVKKRAWTVKMKHHNIKEKNARGKFIFWPFDKQQQLCMCAVLFHAWKLTVSFCYTYVCYIAYIVDHRHKNHQILLHTPPKIVLTRSKQNSSWRKTCKTWEFMLIHIIM